MRPKQALVVEDTVEILEVVTEFLRDVGWHVFGAESAMDALAVLADHGKDIVLLLTDVIMPGISGIELAHRAMAAYPDIRVVLMTGYAGHVPRDWLPIVYKPFRRDDLLTAVNAAVA